ncbi:tetratricopeptide repeat protein [Moorena producens PAL-8-15-08-1]|uniref:Tetratricopeptide repeat protein n=1 Tax=Moorena producens PAL-8-15-08-1 TaxID=1458985 RepID=A0A1D8U367_9CYAN|nr:tetratricopeptide repeat protein [Moorena producens PAL-8-15-08-1]
MPQNLPHTHVSKFVGRESELETLHQGLQQRERVVISAISGMGGIGKTELALQYALNYYQENYLGGVCWLQARDGDLGNLGTQIVKFARKKMKLSVPQKLDDQPLNLDEQAQWCWDNWQPSDNLVLVIFDDVTKFDNIKPYLPPNQPRFKIIITTRKQSLAESFDLLALEVLSEKAALELLESLIGKERLNRQWSEAKKLCKWLGYLPLGLELVGRDLKIFKKYLSLAEMQERLEKKHLEQESLTEAAATMTAQKGVAAAFELSWLELDQEAQQLGCLLSLFALAPIPWELVENSLPDQDSEDLEDIRDYSLLELNLLGRTGQGIYQLHELIRAFLRDKMERYHGADQLKQGFAQAMVAVADKIPEVPTLEHIATATPAIPHLTETATVLSDWLTDEDLYKPFQGLGWFYQGQGAYEQALPWLERCKELTRNHLGIEHPAVATSLHNLAVLYSNQGRYCEAENLFVQALEIRKKLYGQQHPSVPESLNSLALLYSNQGQYCEAEPLFVQALEMYKKLYDQEHQDVATCLDNLAVLYSNQGQYSEAELLLVEALEMRKKLLGQQHPHVAISLNNLAVLYRDQGRYSEAEYLFAQALEMSKKLYGQEHPELATSLHNLASLYNDQGRYSEGEPLFVQALEIRKKLLGTQHPDVVLSLNNLAVLYMNQGRYSEGEPLFVQALEIRKKLLGTQHPDVAISLNNLAKLYFNQGRYSEAESLFVQALEMFKKLLGTEHPLVAISVHNLALLYNNQGQYCEAEPLFVQALDIFEGKLGSNHPKTIPCRENLQRLRDELT